jgi:thiamine biosynthesis lipoprotein
MKSPIIMTFLFFASLSHMTTMQAVEMEILSGRAMGTSYSLKLASPFETDNIQEVANLVKDELERIEAIFSLYRTESELSRWNAASEGEWLDVSEDLYRVTEFAIELSQQTDGAFDPTVRPLMELWQINSLSDSWQPPTTEAIQLTKKHIGVTHVELRTTPWAILKRHGQVKLDLNALVEGWAIDRVRSLLEANGYRNFLFELGGEFCAVGKPNQASTWRIGIEDPNHPARFNSKVALNDEAISTSGVSKQGRSYLGKRYSHIIDPRSGGPIDHDLRSVSVVHAKAMVADGWSTALLVLGPKEGKLLAEQKGLIASFVNEAPQISQVGLTVAAAKRFELVRIDGNPFGWNFKVAIAALCVLLILTLRFNSRRRKRTA